MCEFVVDVKGEGILEPTKLEEIEPGKKYYMQQVWKTNEFHPTVFSHSVSWSTIEELFKTGRIWRLTQEKKEVVMNFKSETGSENLDGQRQ